MTTLLVAVLSAVPCEDFAVGVQNAWNKGEDPLTAIADMRVVVERATEGMGRDSEFLRGFRVGALKAPLGARIRKTLDDNQSVVIFLRCRERARFPTALFSVRHGDSSFGHFELELRPRRGGGVRVVDFWASFDGEWLSVNVRRLALVMMPSSEPGAVLRARLFGEQLLLTDEHLASMRALVTAAQAADARATEQAFARLPAVLQKDRSFMGLRVAGTSGDAEAAAPAVEAYIKAFPDDPSVAIKAFDYHFARKNFDACLAAIDTLEHAIGEDPWLEVLRARVELAANHLGVATEHADRAIELEPWNVQAWFTALDCAVARKDHSRTSRLLDGAVKAGAKYTRESLGASDAFADFMRSPEGKRWRPPAAAAE